MPTSPDNDPALSALLHKAEPPKSPAHLDEKILRYAREQAEANAAAQRDASSSGFNLEWLRRHWVPAAATFSVGAIAISISLQQFTAPELVTGAASNSAAERVQAETLALRQEAPATRAPAAPAVTDAVADAAAPAEVREQQAFADTAGVASNATAELVEQEADAAKALAEATTTQAARRAASPAAIRSDAPDNAAPALADTLGTDAALQDAVIIALRRALGMREQTQVQRRGQFSDEIRPYLETYRDISSATIQDNVQNRYSVARSELLEPRLPESLAELVTILEQL